MVGIHFSLNGQPIGFGVFVKVLITGESFDRFHVFHPEVIGINAYGSDSLFERQLNFESEPIQTDDVQARKTQIR